MKIRLSTLVLIFLLTTLSIPAFANMLEKTMGVTSHDGIYLICIRGTQWVYSVDVEENRQDDAISTNLVQVWGLDGKPMACDKSHPNYSIN